MKVLITGSFDPITNGHMDIIYRAEELYEYDNIVIAVMDNLDKKYMFTQEQRLALVKESVPEYMDVISHTGMLNELLEEFDDVLIVRGLRNSMDYEYEKSVESFTRKFHIPTIYINSSPETQDISSSLIRNLIKADAGYDTISNLMPDVMVYELMEGFLNEDDKL